jgi:serine phosphatase RsbU (regulator of sigma subunit)
MNKISEIIKVIKLLLLVCFVLFPLTTYAQQQADAEFEELANAYNNQGNFSQAAEYYNKSGYVYWNRRNNAKAIDVFQKAYTIYNKLGNNNASIAIGNNLGLIYLEENKYNNAYTAFTNVLEHARKTNNKAEIFNTLLNISNVSLELASYNDAINKANEALEIAKEFNNFKKLRKCYSLIAEAYDKMGDASNAFKYYETYLAIDQKIKSLEMEEVKNTSTEEINRAHEKKRITEIELKIKTGELKNAQDSLAVTERLAYEQQMQIDLRNVQLRQKEVQLKYEKQLRSTLIIGIVIVLVFLIALVFLLKQIITHNKTLKRQKEEITEQRNELDLKNKKITDSIYYGLRIQQAMLPEKAKIDEAFESFIIYKPRDIVSGDFYWFYEAVTQTAIYHFVAVVDCTGHGVPGAFMSMIGNRLLNEIVVERKIYQPCEILEEISDHLKRELAHEDKKTIDGMDIALCRITANNNELVFAGAKRDLMVYRAQQQEIETLEGTNITLGSIINLNQKKISEKNITLVKNDCVYMFTDGIIDQQNFMRKRFGSELFTKAILSHANEPMENIKKQLEGTFNNFMHGEDQRDDITVLGIRII